MVADVLARAKTGARAKLADLRTALDADLPAMREVFQYLFPEGLTFRPAANTPLRVWAISGTARLDSLKLSSDPKRVPIQFETGGDGGGCCVHGGVGPMTSPARGQ
jgi:hypothetical protein